MNSDSSDLETLTQLMLSGAPLRCRQPMSVQPLPIWTATKAVAALFVALSRQARAGHLEPTSRTDRLGEAEIQDSRYGIDLDRPIFELPGAVVAKARVLTTLP